MFFLILWKLFKKKRKDVKRKDICKYLENRKLAKFICIGTKNKLLISYPQ